MPSPRPLRIVEAGPIKALVELGVIVIASGGGGIPVVEGGDGLLEGIDAVIDKDRAGARLAEEVGAEVLLILTDVEYALKNYGKPDQEPLRSLTVAQARVMASEGHFGAGSMGPKVEACLEFLERGGERAIITSLQKAAEALEGKTGTHITTK